MPQALGGPEPAPQVDQVAGLRPEGVPGGQRVDQAVDHLGTLWLERAKHPIPNNEHPSYRGGEKRGKVQTCSYANDRL